MSVKRKLIVPVGASGMTGTICTKLAVAIAENSGAPHAKVGKDEKVKALPS